MSGFLLDTNTVRVWFDAHHPQHRHVAAAVEQLSDNAPLYVSAVTRGEIYFGHAFDGDDGFRQQYRRWVDEQFPQELPIGNRSATIYGRIRAEVCRKYAPPGGWKKKKRAEQLYDPVAGREIGIDENDLWLASQALERNLVMVTTDKMDRIVEAITSLADDELATYSEFQVVNWCMHPLP